MKHYSDTHRYDQTGYSAPTIWPDIRNYTDKGLWVEDYSKALHRNESHLEWLWEEQQEARLEWKIEQAEIKAERDLHDY